MRERLFRGKRINNGEWVYGFYFCMYHDDDREHLHHFIIPLNVPIPKDKPIGEIQVEVDPKTIGQYTGKTDKYNAIIFEDDIIRANHDGAVGVIRFGEYMSPSDPDPTRHIGYYVDWQGKEKDFLRADLGYWASRSDVEVVGNIHDNPELVKPHGD